MIRWLIALVALLAACSSTHSTNTEPSNSVFILFAHSGQIESNLLHLDGVGSHVTCLELLPQGGRKVVNAEQLFARWNASPELFVQNQEIVFTQDQVSRSYTIYLSDPKYQAAHQTVEFKYQMIDKEDTWKSGEIKDIVLYINSKR